MEKLHVDILRQNRVRLAKDLDLDELLQVLVQNKIITVLCVEKVLSEPTFFQKKVYVWFIPVCINYVKHLQTTLFLPG